MEFVPLSLEGVFGIISNPTFDDRGAFMRVFDKSNPIDSFVLTQASVVTNPVVGTLRGLHFQAEGYAETKIVHCISGSVFDVVVDLRKSSTTFKEHLSVSLGLMEAFQGILIPKGFAHGYLTCNANSTLLYFMDQSYNAEFAKGIAWNDPMLKIDWPNSPTVISTRDSSFPSIESI